MQATLGRAIPLILSTALISGCAITAQQYPSPVPLPVGPPLIPTEPEAFPHELIGLAPTPTSSPLPSATPTASPTPPDFDTLAPLPQIALSREDADTDKWTLPAAFLYSFPGFPVDITAELGTECLEACYRGIWRDSNSALTVTIVRHADMGSAQDALHRALAAFQDAEGELLSVEDPLEGIEDTSWLAFGWNDWAYSSRMGTLLLSLEWHIDWEMDIDGSWTAVELQNLGEMQLSKLAAAGYPR